jgi:hypothetical protein
MRRLIFAVALAAVGGCWSPAFADFIDFSQFGTTGTSVASGATGTTAGGVTFTISNGGSGFTEYCEDKNRQCDGGSYTWAGEFYKDEVILFSAASGTVTIDFSTPITSLVDLQAQANNYGAFTETLTAYDGSTVVATDSADWFNSVSDTTYGEGTIPKLSVYYALGITSITIGTTNDGGGFALGGVGGEGNITPGAPEPSTWAMMALGFAALGFAGRRSLRRAAVV